MPTARTSTANRPTPSVNLERSGAKKITVRKRTLRILVVYGYLPVICPFLKRSVDPW
ncbi:UNVERIFIED_CONTAM: hypothetical protein FKN15_063147 [Acipenser sinensis]